MSRSLVFIPGWCLGRGPLEFVVQSLAGEFIDLPGYRDAPRCVDFSEAVQRIATALPASCALAGWSIGAQLALAVAARYPQKVSRLLLVAGTASFVQREAWPQAMAPETLAEFSAAFAEDPASMLPRFVGGFNRGDAQAKEVTRRILASADPLPSKTILADGLAWLRDLDLRAEAATIRVPTLLIHGAADPLMPLPAAQALTALIPGAQLQVLSDCAHAPFLSQPEIFLEHARAFLA
ncbi:alpha/beta fold hydrolase [Azonexus sp.]|uniref:alpha/beta fold hydrolase n=1 Tax=Azonexus sp. TaxID=1872668 RepID=UPI0039E3E156